MYIQKLIKADIPVKAIKTDRQTDRQCGTDIALHVIIFALDGGKRSASHLGPFDLGKENPVTTDMSNLMDTEIQQLM